MRPDQRRPVPDLLLGGLGQAPGQGVADRLAGHRPARSSRSAGPAALLRGDLAVGGPERLGDRLEQGQPGGDHRRPGVEQGGVPEAELVTAGLLLADRPQQAVALLERPAVGRQVGRVRRRTRRWPASRARPGGAPASPRSGASPRARRGPPAASRPGSSSRRGTPFTRIRLRWPPLPSRSRATSRVAPPARPSRRRRRPRPGPGRRPSGSSRRRSASGASDPTRAGRSPRAGWSCRRHSARGAGAGRGRGRAPGRGSPAGRSGAAARAGGSNPDAPDGSRRWPGRLLRRWSGRA